MDVQAQAKEVRRRGTALSPLHGVLMAEMVWARGLLKLQNSSSAGKQQAPEPCFCSSGCGANQEMQDESISEK